MKELKDYTNFCLGLSVTAQECYGVVDPITEETAKTATTVVKFLYESGLPIHIDAFDGGVILVSTFKYLEESTMEYNFFVCGTKIEFKIEEDFCK